MKGIKLKTGYSLKKKPNAKALDNKLKEAAKMYEKQFLREMVKAMRSTVTYSEMSKPGYAEKIYQNQLDNQYAENWGDTGGIGLSKLIYEQIKERFYNKNKLNMPKGPIEINNKPKFLKSEKLKNNMMPVETKSGDKDLSYIFSPESIKGNTVTAPWSGIIKNSFADSANQVLEIQHDMGLSSLISFNGDMNKSLTPGTKVKSGESLAGLSKLKNPLYWKLFS